MEEAVTILDNARREVKDIWTLDMVKLRWAFQVVWLRIQCLPQFRLLETVIPEVKFQLKQGAYYDLIDRVSKGDIDMALLGPVPMRGKKVKGSNSECRSFAANQSLSC